MRAAHKRRLLPPTNRVRSRPSAIAPAGSFPRSWPLGPTPQGQAGHGGRTADANAAANASAPPALGRVSRIASRLVGSGAQPDEDVRDSNGGLVAGGELVKAGRDRPELLAAVHQPLHLIPVAGAGPVKGRRPTAPGTTTGPVGRLIITLRDRVADAAGPQRRPVGAAAVGLIAGQVIRSRARPPTTAGPSHPHLVHQPDQLGGVSVLPRGQPGGQVAATPIADRVELGGQPTP